ncbi:octanoyl-[acyl-carrier-protein]:protein N-octanoyltransferase LIPT2, mitochondrial-like [Hydra vulgaris]|uniref:Octanoyl-[acyl-carrier-protein]:protein N-octanoyltransferase LIPT2, mitochondrial n=1 Tax=Hydra vulgaris TaxID=6087 RepID=A0ABM4D658_HYDVU
MFFSKPFFKNVALQNFRFQTYNSSMQIMKSFENILRTGCDKTMYGNILICEHPPVYTVGIRKKSYIDGDIIRNLKDKGAEFCYADRGGLITFHGPGQLVCYPILDLKKFNLSIRCYINQLEQVIIDTCTDLGVATERTNDVGVWVKENKIAAIGVHCRQHISTHGLAINCNTNLNWFKNIVPCGLVGKGVTSLSKELNDDITVDHVLPIFLKRFEKTFGCEIK